MKLFSRILVALSLLPLSLHAQQGQELRFPVIPVQFGNLHFTLSEEGMKSMLSEAGDYFESETGKKYRFTLLKTVTLQKGYEYYGANGYDRRDALIHELVSEACQQFQSDSYMASCDNDGDGFIDGVLILLPGKAEGDSGDDNAFWPQFARLSDFSATATAGGKKVDAFISFTELDGNGNAAGTGVFCHEFCHILGLPDLYDTDGEGSGGESKALWKTTSLMDGGYANDVGHTPPHLNAIEKYLLGTGNCIVAEGRGHYTLRPAGKGGDYLYVATDNEGEFYLMECRKAEGRDMFCGGEGLLIYHIDRSSGNSWYSDFYRRNLAAWERWSLNQVNCRPDHQCAYLVPALSGAERVEDVFFPRPGKTCFSSGSDPSWRFWSGKTSEFAVYAMERNEDGSVSFDLIRPVTMGQNAVFQDAILLSWSTDELLPDCSCTVTCTGGGKVFNPSVSGEDGNFACSIEGLSPGVSYNVSICASTPDGENFYLSGDYRTLRYRENILPFIYLIGASRGSDGSFTKGSRIPLRVFNLHGATAVRWTMDGKEISAEADGYYTLSGSGTLRAEVSYEDGSTGIILKEITVK